MARTLARRFFGAEPPDPDPAWFVTPAPPPPAAPVYVAPPPPPAPVYVAPPPPPPPPPPPAPVYVAPPPPPAPVYVAPAAPAGSLVDPRFNPYFGPVDVGDGQQTLGNGNGIGYLSALMSLPGSDAYIRSGGWGENSNGDSIDREALAQYLAARGWSIMSAPAPGNRESRWIQDRDGRLVTEVETFALTDSQFGTAMLLVSALVGNVVAAYAAAGGAAASATAAADPVSAYLTTGAVEGSTVGGSLAGGGAAGAVGSGSTAALLQGAQTAAISGAQNGTINGVISEVRGGDFVDGFGTGFASGFVGSGISSLGIPESVGITYQPAAAAVNAGLSGGLITEARGGDFVDGFRAGAVGSAITSGLQAIIDTVSSWTAPAADPLPTPAPTPTIEPDPAPWWAAPVSAPDLVPLLPTEGGFVPDFAPLPDIPELRPALAPLPVYQAAPPAWDVPPVYEPAPVYTAPPVYEPAPVYTAPVYEAAPVYTAPPLFEPAPPTTPWWAAPISAPDLVPLLPTEGGTLPDFAPLPIIPELRPALSPVIVSAAPKPAPAAPKSNVTPRDVQRAIGLITALVGGGKDTAAPGAPGAPRSAGPGAAAAPGAPRAAAVDLPSVPLPAALALGAGILAALAFS